MNGWNSPYTAGERDLSLPFSVYRRENDRSVTIFDIRNGQVYERKRRCGASTSEKR